MLEVKKTSFRELFEGSKQFQVPLYQRNYSWQKKNWERLWDDLKDLRELKKENQIHKSHFFGTIVLFKENISKGMDIYLIIDGQQRISTILILLILLRDMFKEKGENENLISLRIQDTFLINQYFKNEQKNKFIPTTFDKENFFGLLNRDDYNKNISNRSIYHELYVFFEKKFKIAINNDKNFLNDMFEIITENLIMVKIELSDEEENPYEIFESLNAKGVPLTQSDLIRNYFFMKVPIEERDKIFYDYWFPLQKSLTIEDDDNRLDTFIRHYLMKEGDFVKKNQTYISFKKHLAKFQPLDFIQKLYTFLDYYLKILNLRKENEPEIQKYLKHLSYFDTESIYPLLLMIYDYYSNSKISSNDFIEILKILENFFIRKFIIREETKNLNKTTLKLCKDLKSNTKDIKKSIMSRLLKDHNYPDDEEINVEFLKRSFYEMGNVKDKTKFLLVEIENFLNPNNKIDFDEVVLIQILSKNDRVPEAMNQEITGKIGNLTIEKKQAIESKGSFEKLLVKEKIRELRKSDLKINQYFQNIDHWNKQKISERSNQLLDLFIKIWKDLLEEREQIISDPNDLRYQKPYKLIILDREYNVKSWRDVLVNTFEFILEMEPEKFPLLSEYLSNYVNDKKNGLRAPYELKNGYHLELNLSSNAIVKICKRAIEILELDPDEDWKFFI